MKFPHLIVLALGLFCVPDTFARLGETVAECQQRYGTATKVDSKTLTFDKAGYFIVISFFEGKADSIAYTKLKTDGNGTPIKISDNEIDQLMKLHSGDLEWKKREVISINDEWETSQRDFFAYYDKLHNFLIITTKGFVERNNAEKKAKEDKAIKGL